MKKLIVLLLCLSPLAFGQGQISGAGNVGCSGATTTGTAVTSGTANNTVLYTASNFAAWGYSVQLTQTSTISGGAISFQYSNDGGATYTNVPAAQVLNVSTFAQLTNPYTLVASTNQSFLIITAGASNFQVKLTTALTGSATVTPYITAVCTAPPALALDSSGNLKVNVAAGSLASNQSSNVAQFGGTNVSTGTGAGGAGIPRVTISNDSSLAANQSTNVAQVAGNSLASNNGAAGPGSQRVVIASDNSAVSGLGAGATGAAPPANAILEGGLGSGATGGFLIGRPVGDTYKAINISTATTTLIVTGVSGRQVRITAQHLVTQAANNVAWIEGTGATCGTGTAGMAGGTTAASGYNFAANGGLSQGSGAGTVLQTVTTGDSVCLVTSASTQLSGGIEYTIF